MQCNQPPAELHDTLPLRGDRESSLTNSMEVVCLFPLFYSVWEHRMGNMVSLCSPRKFRTYSKNCDTAGSLTAEKKISQKRISYLGSIFLELWKYRREKLQQR